MHDAIAPRWRKPWRDLVLHRARSLLVVLAVALGLVGAGAVLNTWALVQRATELGYRASLPVSATLTLTAPLEAAQLARVRARPEIAAARLRRVVGAAAQGSAGGGGPWRNAVLYALDDFEARGIARLRSEAGAWPPPAGAIVVERSSLEFAQAELGAPLALRRAGSDPAATPLSLPVAGIVRDVSLAPGWMENVVYGFATADTLARLGAPAGFNELQIRVRDDGAAPFDRAAVRRIAAALKAELEHGGARVVNVDVPVPGRHIHAAQMESLLLTQGAFGLLALLVCGFLVVNLVNAMLAGQAREIGVLKTLGARAGQIAALYLAQALALGLLASAVALPLAWWLGRRYAGLKAELLNFDATLYAIPWWAFALQLLVGALLPVVAAAGPVRRACRVSVGAALRDIGIVGAGQALATRRRVALTGFGGVARPLLLALGNALRRRQRLVLTLLALAGGGAVFLGAANLRGAVRDSVDLMFAAQRHDLTLRLAEPRPGAQLEAAARAVDGIEAAEAWCGKRAALAPAGQGLPGDAFTILGVPADSALLRPRALSGRWLDTGDGDARALVVSRSWLKSQDLTPERALADGAELLIDGRATRWRIVGTVDTGPQPLVYATRAALDALAGNSLASTVAVRTRLRGAASQLEAVQRLRMALAEAGMPVASSQRLAETRRVVEDHLLMVVEFLGAMAWVMIAVGGMGLASTLSLNVLERGREIGVLRAIGARDGAIALLVGAEGLVIVLLAWLVSLPLAMPISALLCEAFGRVMFAVPLRWMPGAGAALAWLGLMLAIALLACAWPARRALRISAARALAYE